MNSRRIIRGGSGGSQSLPVPMVPMLRSAPARRGPLAETSPSPLSDRGPPRKPPAQKGRDITSQAVEVTVLSDGKPVQVRNWLAITLQTATSISVFLSVSGNGKKISITVAKGDSKIVELNGEKYLVKVVNCKSADKADNYDAAKIRVSKVTSAAEAAMESA